jgi:hypothetical protein
LPAVRRWGQSVDDSNSSAITGSQSDSSLIPSLAGTNHAADRVDLEMPIPPQIESATQFKATFDQVKADLASGRWMQSEGDVSPVEGRPRSHSLESMLPSPALSGRSRSGTTGSSKLPSRSQVIQSKIRDLESRLSATQTLLDSDLRLVRNIAVLTPFQQATRDRLRVTVQNSAKKIMQLRLELEKLACHRQVLATDLSAEIRDWRRTKKLALKAATESLQSRLERNVPEISVPSEDVESPISPSTPERSPRDPTHSHRHRDSTLTDSFHSAVDFGMDWASRNSSDMSGIPSGTASLLEVGRNMESPAITPSTSESPMEYPFSNPSRRSTFEVPTPGASPEQGKMSLDAGSEPISHEKYYTAAETLEQAEEWNKTRAGKRVSLVKLPTDLRISTVFGNRSRARAGSTAQASAQRESMVGSQSALPPSPIRDRSGSAYTMLDI